MGIIVGFLASVLIVCLLGLSILGAIWESVRANKEFKRLQQQWHRRQPW
jgi:hypothetical protein